MESLIEIHLSDEEIAELLINAKLRKKEATFIESNKSAMQKEAERPWTAKEMLHHIKQYILHKNPAYVFDEYNKKVIWQLCLYFTNDPRFEENGNSLKKGIMLAGNVGVGKSFLMECFMFNKLKCFQLVTCTNVAETYRNNGFPALTEFVNIKKIIPDVEYLYQKDLGICFDGLGQERTSVSFYKEEMNVMENIIIRRYDAKIPFYYTHFTTDLTWDKTEKNEDGIEQIYTDSRAKDRLYQMVNIIELAGESKRK